MKEISGVKSTQPNPSCPVLWGEYILLKDLFLNIYD